MGFVRNWNLHKQLHPWIKQLMTQPWAEHMVLWAWDRQTSWQQMGQWFQTKVWISSASLDLLHEPPSLMLTTHAQPQHKETAKETLAALSFSAEEAWKSLSHELERCHATHRCYENSALLWDVSPGVTVGSWGPERLVSISKSLRQKNFQLKLNAC